LSLFWCGLVDAKRSTTSLSPVKISDVVITPEPFLIGKSSVTFSMLVELPSYLNGANVLEVSALISSPTRRTMSFVAHRRLLSSPQSGSGPVSVPVVLAWDGKDQYRQLVPDGSYYYEIRAKLMEDEGYGPRTKVVSRRVQGTLDVLAYVGEVLPPVPPEPELPDEILEDIPSETLEETPEEADGPGKDEELPVEDVPFVEEGLKAADDPINSEAPNPGEGRLLDSPESFPESLPEVSPEVQDKKQAGAQNDSESVAEWLPALPVQSPHIEPAIPAESSPPAN